MKLVILLDKKQNIVVFIILLPVLELLGLNHGLAQTRLIFFLVILSPSRQISGWYLKLGHRFCHILSIS